MCEFVSFCCVLKSIILVQNFTFNTINKNNRRNSNWVSKRLHDLLVFSLFSYFLFFSLLLFVLYFILCASSEHFAFFLVCFFFQFALLKKRKKKHRPFAWLAWFRLTLNSYRRKLLSWLNSMQRLCVSIHVSERMLLECISFVMKVKNTTQIDIDHIQWISYIYEFVYLVRG